MLNYHNPKRDFFSALLKEGSTSHPGPLSSGAREKTALLGARNRYALRLADHQRSSPYCAGWDRQGTSWWWGPPYYSLLIGNAWGRLAGWNHHICSSLQYRSALVVARMRSLFFLSPTDCTDKHRFLRPVRSGGIKGTRISLMTQIFWVVRNTMVFNFILFLIAVSLCTCRHSNGEEYFIKFQISSFLY